MSLITIQCRIVANEPTRRTLWKLMAEVNTPLINELLSQVGQHPDFETWRQEGKLKAGIVKQLCQPLRTDPRFIGQPGRFYTSAIAVVEYIYKSWLALQQRLKRQLEAQIRWQQMLRSDAELVEASGYHLDTIKTRAAEILAQLTVQSAPQQINGNKGNEDKTLDTQKSLSASLFEAYNNTEDVCHRCLIAYLLKNGCKVRDKEEDQEKFAKRRRKIEIRIQRLTEKLDSRMPKGRDLTGQDWLKTLEIAASTVPKSETEAKSWQDSLLKEPNSLPFPVAYETNEDMTWCRNEEGRICVHFSGLSELTFQVYCDSRQLHWFQRFLEDRQTKRESRKQHSSSLFTLRSSRIAWQENEGKGEPWNIHRLTLYCCVDTRLWTKEGTDIVREHKTAEIAKVIAGMKKKGDLNEKQQAYVKRKNSTLALINNPFPRPSKPLHQGQSHILVGVSLGLEKPATVAVVDATTGKVLTYRSLHQLLGNNYKLLNRQRQQKQQTSHQRHKAQKQGAPNEFGESELGQYVDRLLAQAIVAIALEYKANSIVIPKVGDMREIVQSEIQARAEQKCPGFLEGQKRYAKQYRRSVHSWSYGRLIESLKASSSQVGISIEEGQQSLVGTPQEKAKNLAVSVYNSRIKAII